MNDQWSGKTLRPNSGRMPEPPTRSSTKSVKRPTFVFATKGASAVDEALMLVTLPVTRSYRFFEVAGCDEVALCVNCDGQLGERTAGRSKDDLAFLREVERGLVARAQKVVCLLLVKSNRATNMGADLGVSNNAVVAPVLAALGGVQRVGIDAHQQNDGLGLFVQLAFVKFVETFGNDVEGRTDGDIRSLDGSAIGVAGQSLELATFRGPHGVCELVIRTRSQVAENSESRERSKGNGTKKGVADQRATLNAGFLDDVVDDAHRSLAIFLMTDSVALFRHLVIGHQGLGPVHDAGANAKHCERRTQAQEQVLGTDVCNRRIVAQIDGEVRHQEDQRADDRGAKQNGYLTLGSLCGYRVRVSQAQTMRRKPRILELLHFILTSRSYGARVVRTAVTMVAHNSPHPSLVVSAWAELIFSSKLLNMQQKFVVSSGL